MIKLIDAYTEVMQVPGGLLFFRTTHGTAHMLLVPCSFLEAKKFMEQEALKDRP